MSAAIQYEAARAFQGVSLEGKPVDFKAGEVVVGVADWPTFGSLSRIGWIVPYKGKVNPPVEKTKEVTAEVVPLATENNVAVDESFACDQCDKAYTSSRSLKVHVSRSHK